MCSQQTMKTEWHSLERTLMLNSEGLPCCWVSQKSHIWSALLLYRLTSPCTTPSDMAYVSTCEPWHGRLQHAKASTQLPMALSRG